MNLRDQIESWTEIRAATAEDKEFLFGPGEWLKEPDAVVFSYKGVSCRVARNLCGSLCGYISLKRGHPWFGLHYDDISCDVHGGLTHSGENGSLWEVGFDCAHSGDISPTIELSLEKSRKGMAKERLELIDKSYEHLPWMRPSYKNIDFVVNECISLADQAIGVLNAVD